MAWTAPRTYVSNELMTAAIGNTHWRDNLTELRAGGIAITSQAALDFLYASSSSQLARLAAGTALQVPRINAAATGWEFATLSIALVSERTAAYTALSTTGDHQFIPCNGTFTVTLYAASGNSGKAITVKNIGTGTITLDGNASETIDGAVTVTIPVQYGSLTLVCDGSNWHII